MPSLKSAPTCQTPVTVPLNPRPAVLPRRRFGAPGWCSLPVVSLTAVLLVPGIYGVAAQTSGKLAGRFLVATSRLRERPFAESVVLIVKHSEDDGAVGLIVNRPMGTIPLSKVLRGKAAATNVEVPIFYGGPVERRQGFLLHSSEEVLPSSVSVLEGVAMTLDREMLQLIAEGKGPARHLFAVGYSGWRANQLETEIGLGSWFTVEADPGLIFSDEPLKTWKQLFDANVLRL
jgi:putative transcriptional regulator